MKLIFKGIVQGVGFRPTIYRIAKKLNLKGYVLNKGAEVEVVIDRKEDLFIAAVEKELPSIARITEIIKKPDARKFTDFTILQSSHGSHESLIPVDVATCEACQKELLQQKNRRYQFPFTNCTVCGARFSVISKVPYDRERTAMAPFQLCSDCQKEYVHVENRRYHAQTISCPQCGPTYHLFDRENKQQISENVVEAFAEYIDEGSIGVVKSWGGMHICCKLDMVKELREWYGRPQKAFAVMVKDIHTAQKIGSPTDIEKDLLQTSARPVVLVNKRCDDLISPGLNSVGIFLPYTGLHYLLFHYLKSSVLIMTSANIPGEPMLLDNKDVFSLNADWYLLHNRAIPNRVDDSVIKVWNSNPMFLRKSRGYVPDPLDVKYSKKIVSVGANDNVYGAVSSKKRLYLTQYIGDSEYYKTLEFLEKSIKHLMTLFFDKLSLDGVGIDRHPAYETRIIGKRFAEEFNVPVVEVLHHWAHAVSLIVDAGVNEAVVLTIDGLGYGDDGTFWGGDVIAASIDEYTRVAHLEYLPLLGGDKATKDPRRLVYAIFPEKWRELGFSESQTVVLKQLVSSSPESCSLGRYLDALSCYLDICCSRTYSGEPAMKLEKYLSIGENNYHFDNLNNNSEIAVVDLFHQLDAQLKRPLTEKMKADACVSIVKVIIDQLVDQAIMFAHQQSIEYIGVSGGVSYNIPILNMIAERVKKEGMKLLVHSRIPNGDGCIAVGQNVIVGNQL